MDRWLGNYVFACAVSVAMWGVGCNGPGEAGGDAAVDVESPQSLKADEEVALLARAGDRTLIRRADGETGFVPSEHVRMEGESAVISVASELDSEPPRPVAEINRERDELGTLFLSADGSKEFVRPKHSAPFYDAASDQACWPAYTCTSDSCPGSNQGNGRNAFAGVLNHLEVHPDGTVTGSGGGFRPLTCPACGGQESVRPYELSETTTRARQLANEHRRRLAWERANR